MGILKEFNFYKCDKCDSNGFIVKNGVAILCDCRKNYEVELKSSDILLKSGLLTENSTYEDFKKLIDYSFDDYHGKDEQGNIRRLKKFVDEFDNPNKPFKNLHCYVYGSQGTQKSYTLKGMLARLACNGKSVYYTFTKDLIDLIIDSDRIEESQKKLDYIMNVDVLVLDEMQSDRCALWKSQFKENSLIIWVKNRLEVVRKSTWFISNDSIEQMQSGAFGNLFGDLIDRETKFGRFEFKDKYFDNIPKENIEEIFNSIWND